MSGEFLAFHGINTLLLVLVSWSVMIAWRASMFTLGHHGMVSAGAYSAAFAIRALDLTEPSVPLFLVVLLAAVLGAALFALVLMGLFSRVASDYFAVGTLAAAEMLRVGLSNTFYLGGSLGFATRDLVPLSSRLSSYLALLILAGAAVAAAYFWYSGVTRSPYGLAISAINQDAHMAEYLGVDSRRLRTVVFVVGSAFAGLAGGLTLHLKQSIIPSDFGFVAYISVLLVVILAGDSQRRLLVWAVVVYGLSEAVRSNVFGLDPALASYREMLLTTALLVILLVRAWLERSWSEAPTAGRVG